MRTRRTIAIVDWRDVPTWTEFEILRDAFVGAGVPTVMSDPRELVFDGRTLTADGQHVDLVYRRVLINDVLAGRTSAARWSRPTARRPCAWRTRSGASSPHKKAFFAVLTDRARGYVLPRTQLDAIRSHVPWTRLVHDGPIVEPAAGQPPNAGAQAERRVGGAGVMSVGNRRQERGMRPSTARSPTGRRLDSAGADQVRREIFPVSTDAGIVTGYAGRLRPYL